LSICINDTLHSSHSNNPDSHKNQGSRRAGTRLSICSFNCLDYHDNVRIVVAHGVKGTLPVGMLVCWHISRAAKTVLFAIDMASISAADHGHYNSLTNGNTRSSRLGIILMGQMCETSHSRQGSAGWCATCQYPVSSKRPSASPH